MNDLDRFYVVSAGRSASEPELAALAARLRDPAGRARFVEEIALDAALVEALRTQSALRAAFAPPPAPAPRRCFPGWRPLLALAASIAIVAAGLHGWLSRPAPPGARLSHRSGKVWIVRGAETLPPAATTPLQPGDRIVTGEDSAVRLRFLGEATWLDLANESEVVLTSLGAQKKIELRRGGVEARVAPQPAARPMICRTPWGVVTVVGTRFTLTSADEQRVSVIQGSVRLAVENAPASVEVKAGQYAEPARNSDVTVATLWSGTRFEAESLQAEVSARGGFTKPVLHSRLQGGMARWCMLRGPGAAVRLELPAIAPGRYLIKLGLFGTARGGIFETWVEGRKIGPALNACGFPDGTAEFVLGEVEFDSHGPRSVECRVVGQDAAARATDLTLDYLDLVPLPGRIDPGWTGAADAWETPAGEVLSAPAPGVLANDPAAHDRTAVLVASPARGTARLGADGALHYEPEGGFSGPDELSYRLWDGERLSAPVPVSLTVRPRRAQLDLARSASTPDIDGELDPAWRDVPPVELRHRLPGHSADSSAQFRAKWDADHLYLFVHVRDATPQRDSGDRHYDDDAVEIYLAAPPAGAHAPAPAGPGWAAWRLNRGEQAPRPFSGHARLAAVMRSRETPGGWAAEAAIPWRAIGLPAGSAALEVGLDVHVTDDVDGGKRDGLLAWFNRWDAAWFNPATLGPVRLALPPAASAARPPPENPAPR